MKYIVSLFLFVLLSIGFVAPVFAKSPSPTPVEKRLEALVISIKDERILTDGSVRRKYQKIYLTIISIHDNIF